MEKQFERTVRLIGETRQRRLLDSAVAIFGVGGVGSFVAEALCRAGVGKLTFIDADVVDVTSAGEAAMAGIVWGSRQGMTADEIVCTAMAAGMIATSSPATISADMSVEKIGEIIRDFIV